MTPKPPEPRTWMRDPTKFGWFGYADDEHWKLADTPANEVLRAAAQRQYDRCVELRSSIAMDQERHSTGEPKPDLTGFAKHLAVMSYDTLWAVLHGRVKLTLVHEEDIRQARVQTKRAIAAQKTAIATATTPDPTAT